MNDKQAKTLMLVGTGSSVGKSVICAALCRIFTQDGLDVMPFKSQNMSNNSYITADGHEMGRAQVMQAECARKAPDARMNPILLKPSSDRRSQLIFNGKLRATQDAKEYYQNKNKLRSELLEIFNQIKESCDLVVLEGAGSPAEINLKENDLVNMGMAMMADAPTVLIGDIDKGGVFASLYGTVMLLEPEERRHIKGFIINKFRGDPALLEPGLRQIEDLTGIPVLGVVPYFDLVLEDEDSVVDFSQFQSSKMAQILSPDLSASECQTIALDVVVMQIPYMSNFTDLQALALEPGVSMRFVKPGESIGHPDLIVIPGCKSTMFAAKTLQDTGSYGQIQAAHAAGAHVFGICGGYQILGKRIEDPMHSESSEDACEGIGLLDLTTIFSDEKTTVLSSATDSLFGNKVNGYEIHMGTQKIPETVQAFLLLDSGASDGAISKDRRCIGTYFHGIFDNGAFTRAYLNKIREDHGRPKYTGPLIDYPKFKDEQYDKLAAHISAHVDIDALRRIIDGGV